MSAHRCLCLGECMVELRPVEPGLYARGFAGDAYNTAVHLRRELGSDGEVGFVTVLGDDALSADMRRAFRAEGVDDRLAFTAPGGAPGLYLIELDAAGERDFHYWRQASAARGWARALAGAGGADVLAGADLVYLSGVSLAILDPPDRALALDLLRAARGAGRARVAFDPNVRPRLWGDLAQARAVIESATALADILLPSQDDGAHLWGEVEPERQLLRWRALGAAEIALTLGREGALVAWPDGETRLAAPDPPGRVVDTSGAGDSFNGAYLAARLRGAAPAEAAARGLALAAEVVTSPGAIPPRRVVAATP